jgi:hypothetical protein
MWKATFRDRREPSWGSGTGSGKREGASVPLFDPRLFNEYGQQLG